MADVPRERERQRRRARAGCCGSRPPADDGRRAVALALHGALAAGGGGVAQRGGGRQSSLRGQLELPANNRLKESLPSPGARSLFREKLNTLEAQLKVYRHGNEKRYLRIEIDRKNLLRDTFRAFQSPEFSERDNNGALRNLRERPVRIKFASEPGIDEGGLRREWFTKLSREFCKADYALFKTSMDNDYTFQINENSAVNEDHLMFFELLGKVLAKAVCDWQPLDTHFNSAFYKQLLGHPLDLTDLEAVDQELHKNLRWIQDNDLTGMDLDIYFSVSTDNFGVVTEHDLVTNGRNIEVTNANKLDFIRKKSLWKMRDCISEQMEAIRRGFSLVLRDCPEDKYDVQLPCKTKVGYGMSINQDGVVTKWRDPDPQPVVVDQAPSTVTLQVPSQLGQNRIVQFVHTDGRQVRVRVPAGVPSGARIKVEVPVGPPPIPEERVKVGSQIIAVNARPVGTKEDIVAAIARSAGAMAQNPASAQTVKFTFKRGDLGVLSGINVQPRELELLLHGVPSIDLEDWRKNTDYRSKYNDNTAQIRWFWEFLNESDDETRSAVLRFVTGTPKVPVQGFDALRGSDGPRHFTIERVQWPQSRLPQAQTCFNVLHLPPYESKELLKAKLELAITEAGEGFQLK